jgi:hypothetical protein
MGNVQKKDMTGKVIGHVVKFLPRKVEQRSSGVTITKEKKLGAFVTIQVDDKKTYTATSKSVEAVLDGDRQPTDELKTEIYNTLVDAHPFGSERTFTEFTIPKGKAAIRRYELLEEDG